MKKEILDFEEALFLKSSNPAVTYAAAEHQGCLFWITCKQLKLLRKASCLQVIENLAPFVVRWRQCDIRIDAKMTKGLSFINCKINCLLTLCNVFVFCFRITYHLLDHHVKTWIPTMKSPWILVQLQPLGKNALTK